MKQSKRIITAILIIVMIFSMALTAFAASGTWKKSSKGWWYSYSSGGYAADKWEYISGKWYHFDSDGYMETGWIKDGGKWYCLGSNGAMKTGWVKSGGKWYYLGTNGTMTTGWQKVSGEWYYMDSSGAMQTGWVKSGGKWYYLAGSGVMQTGWQKIGGKWYYFKPSGIMVTGTVTIGGKTYHFGSNGVWISDSKPDYSSYIGSWVYSEDDGTSKQVLTLEILSINSSTATFEVRKFLYNSFGAYGYESPARIVETDKITAPVSGNIITYSYTDSYENTGTGTIQLNGNTIHLVSKTTKLSSWARYEIKADNDLKKR